jgi:hypothetical protein
VAGAGDRRLEKEERHAIHDVLEGVDRGLVA